MIRTGSNSANQGSATTVQQTADKTVERATGPADRPVVDKRAKALQRFALSITIFNILGFTILGFEQAPIAPIIGLAVGYSLSLVMEFLDSRAFSRTPEYAGGRRALGLFLLPPHITALACVMLLYANASLWPYLFAIIVGISSKYLIRWTVKGRRRHFLNPSNFGIVVTLILFPWVGIAPPYHFTNNFHAPVAWLAPLVILAAGTMLNGKLTGKGVLIVAWLGGFFLQAALRWLLLDESLVAMLLPMTGLAFVLFTNYMITDPGTTPVRARSQAIFGLTVALMYGILVVCGVVFGLFFALAITCVLRGLVLVASTLTDRVRRPRIQTPSSPGSRP